MRRTMYIYLFGGINMKEENLKLVSAKELANILSTSVRSVWRYRAAGKLPKSVVVGSCVRWRESDVAQWIELDCPDRETFEVRKGQK